MGSGNKVGEKQRKVVFLLPDIIVFHEVKEQK